MQQVFTSIFLCILSFSCSSFHQKPTILIPEGKVGMVGYGSLLSKASMESTLGHKYTDSIYQVNIRGYKRKWNMFLSDEDSVFFPGAKGYETFYIVGEDTLPTNATVYLNIEPDPTATMNAMLYLLTEEELKLFDRRETGYRRVDITLQLEGVDVNGGKVYAYQALPEYSGDITTNLSQFVLPKRYVELVYKALDSLGQEYRMAFEDSTVPFDSSIVARQIWLKTDVEQY